jgi:hypothetical protein
MNQKKKREKKGPSRSSASARAMTRNRSGKKGEKKTHPLLDAVHTRAG